jgi:histidine triad (HIT) family protein
LTNLLFEAIFNFVNHYFFYTMTIFSKIIKGEIPCYKIYEDEFTFAFLDINPFQKGHTLIVPKIEVDNWIDVSEEYYNAVQKTARLIAPAIQKGVNSIKVGQLIDGRQVPHFHLHLIPIFEGFELQETSGFEPKSENMINVQNKIISFI